jgi:hypothetical protein
MPETIARLGERVPSYPPPHLTGIRVERLAELTTHFDLFKWDLNPGQIRQPFRVDRDKESLDTPLEFCGNQKSPGS